MIVGGLTLFVTFGVVDRALVTMATFGVALSMIRPNCWNYLCSKQTFPKLYARSL